MSPVAILIIFLWAQRPLSVRASLSEKVVFAINAGGPAHRDVYGVNYAGDDLRDGVASDFGKRFDIQRVAPEDHILYQTERYSTDKRFTYDIPINKGDGNYVLVLKFCEVYFRAPRQKVFSVVLNNQIVLSAVDIFDQVGMVATAHDEYITFQVKNQGTTLRVHDKETKIKNKKIPLSFQRGGADNPKVNAFYIVKSSINDVPKLPPMAPPRHHAEEDEDFEDYDGFTEEVEFDQSDLGHENSRLRTFSAGKKKGIRSGPEHMDPWDMKSTQEKYSPIIMASAAGLLSVIVISFVTKKL